MKLKVIVNTHGRPAQALAVIECLRALSSGRHVVDYVLAYDVEDERTDNFMMDLFVDGREPKPAPLRFDCEFRPASLQDVWNRNMLPPFEHDFYLPMPDDGFCAAPDWDDLIVQTAVQAPVPGLAVLGWDDQANPGQFTVPIVARGWLEAIAPEPLMDPTFDAWFADTAIAETWSYVFGRPPPRPDYLKLAGKPGRPNPRLMNEDPDALWETYAAGRNGRLKTARRIREEHGIAVDEWPANLQQIIDRWIARDLRGLADLKTIIANMRACASSTC